MSETPEMTKDQIALAEQNKAALEKDNKETNTSNEPLVACHGACSISPTYDAAKTENSKYLMDIHNSMVADYAAITEDETLTESHRLLLKDDLVTAARANFEAKVSQAEADMMTEAKHQQSKLFSANPRLDKISEAMLPVMVPMLVKNHYDFLDNGSTADIINIMNIRGLFPDPIKHKLGKPRQDISDQLDKRYSPEAFTRIGELMQDAKTLSAIAKREKAIIKKMQPNSNTVSKIRAKVFKGKK